MKYIKKFGNIDEANGLKISKPFLGKINSINEYLSISKNGYTEKLTIHPVTRRIECLQEGEFYTTYEVTDTTSTTKLLYTNSNIASMEIDGGIVNISTSYKFNTTGTHYVKYKLSDITTTDDYVFYGCAGLTSITIPDSVTSIGAYAFKDCSGLTSVTMSDNIIEIGFGAFYSCSTLSSFTIPNSIEIIYNCAFVGCSSLASINIPKKLISIGNNCYSHYSDNEMTFTGCTGLMSITVDKDNTVYNDGNGSNCIIETASNTLIQGCNTTIIPDNITSIAINAFSGLKSLTSITLPSNLSTIYFVGTAIGFSQLNMAFGTEHSPFEGSGISSVYYNIENAVTCSYGRAEYANCLVSYIERILNTISNLIIGPNVKQIKVISSGVGSSVTSGTDFPFTTSDSTIITVNAITPPELDVTFSCSTIYVPAESVDIYKTADGWSTYADKIQAISE